MKKLRGPTLSIRAKGPLAIFTRPELKTERVSYEAVSYTHLTLPTNREV